MAINDASPSPWVIALGFAVPCAIIGITLNALALWLKLAPAAKKALGANADAALFVPQILVMVAVLVGAAITWLCYYLKIPDRDHVRPE